MQQSTSSGTRKLVTGSLLAASVICLGAIFAIPAALRSMLSSGFLPHAYCYLFNKQLIALHAGSDAAIWLSYLAISGTLVYLVWRTRQEIPFSWMFLAFGTFIVACGFTHFMEIVVLWKPLYWFAGDLKLVTAVASVVTAVALPGLVPHIHEMVKSAHLSEERRRQVEQANAELQRLSSHVMGVQDTERRRLARELHDGVGQYLAAIKMSSEVALEDSMRGDGMGALKDSLALLDRCTAEVRTMSHLLHPPLLEEMGLASAVPWYVDGFRERSGIEVNLDMQSKFDRLPPEVELVLFRVLQESLTNIHRHSHSKIANICFYLRDGIATLEVEDRGKGFGSKNGVPLRTGVGIASMRERVRELGGELGVCSGPTGTNIKASVPLQKKETEWLSESSS